MSGFSPEWLRLREPADHRSRDQGLVRRLAGHLAGRAPIRIADFGCGTGSNLRALAPALPGPQHWRLIDYDPSLLEAARAENADWMAASPDSGLAVAYETADLRADLEKLLAEDCDLVTAAALFDLMSPDWLARFAALLSEKRRAFYTVLIYDGAMEWQPAHEADRAIGEAFNAHQHTDKGFGSAAGPDAGACLAEALRKAGFDVTVAQSPWRLTREDLPLMLATADGIAGAARETEQIGEAELREWETSRLSLDGCVIGHTDILALPKD